jgi:hypothetical protein
METSEQTLLGVTLTAINNARSFWEEAKYQGMCLNCERMKGLWEAHHVLFKQTCRREHAPMYSPDNAIRLCSGQADRCHERHHESGDLRIPMHHLRDENFAFIVVHLGLGPAINYLDRHYIDAGDSRFLYLLEQYG